jgi:hypothetical protein
VPQCPQFVRVLSAQKVSVLLTDRLTFGNIPYILTWDIVLSSILTGDRGVCRWPNGPIDPSAMSHVDVGPALQRGLPIYLLVVDDKRNHKTREIG